jgi:hypothetical protein
MNVAQNAKAPATARNGAGARCAADHSSLSEDSVAAMQAQRLARAGIPPHIAAILAPVAFGGGAHHG